MEKSKNQSDKVKNNSIDKALFLLNYFNMERITIGLSELSRMSGMPKATVYRLLSTMESHGYLQKVDILGKERQYQLGLKFLEMGNIVGNNIELKNIALPFMKELLNSINESVQLVVQSGNDAIYIEKLESTRHIRAYTRVGRRAPLYAGACPRAIFSFLPDKEINNILNTVKLKKYTKNTIIDKEKIWENIKRARQLGYTISYGELAEETFAIGAPLKNHTASVAGSLSIVGPEQRLNSKTMNSYIKKVLKATNDISGALGYKKTK